MGLPSPGSGHTCLTCTGARSIGQISTSIVASKLFSLQKLNTTILDGRQKILLSDNPFDIKKTGESIQDSSEWLEIREGIYEEIIRTKFEQNPSLLARLLQTGDRQIYEATTNPFWGTNTGLRSKATFTLTPYPYTTRKKDHLWKRLSPVITL